MKLTNKLGVCFIPFIETNIIDSLFINDNTEYTQLNHTKLPQTFPILPKTILRTVFPRACPPAQCL